MNVFHCAHCQQLLFFENVQCVRCGHPLAYLPDLKVVGSLEPAGGDLWHSPLPQAAGRVYRLCANYHRENVCNWAVLADEEHTHCVSCRLNRMIPDLSKDANLAAWFKLEQAKRP